jgi:predicted transcriptional regulator
MNKKNNLTVSLVKKTIEENPNASYSDLAKLLNCSKSGVYYFIQKNNIIHHKYYNIDRKNKAEITDRLVTLVNEKNLEIALLENTIHDLQNKKHVSWYKKIINFFTNK